MTPEHELLERARSNDRQALSELYDRYALRIYGYLYRRTGNSQVAEDLTADVFVKVLEAVHASKSWKVSFQAWLYRIAHNVVADWYRGQDSRPLYPMDETIGDAAARVRGGTGPDAWSREELRGALMELTESQQQVLVLRFGEGLRAREIAEVLGKSVGSIEALQHRALEALRKRLEGSG
jgi:RNA polymerase sigma-70 factor (ECF subfamily)